MRFDVVGPIEHRGVGPQQQGGGVDIRDKGGAGLQPHKRAGADSPGASAGAGRVPVLVQRKEPGDDLVGSQLLLPLQQRGLHNEGDREVGEGVLHIPVSPRERQVGALQKRPPLLPLKPSVIGMHFYSIYTGL